MGSDEENLDDLLSLLKEEENEAEENETIEESIEDEIEENGTEELLLDEGSEETSALDELLNEGMQGEDQIEEEELVDIDDVPEMNEPLMDESSLDDMGLFDFALDEEEEGLISPDEVDAMFAAADAAIASEMQDGSPDSENAEKGQPESTEEEKSNIEEAAQGTEGNLEENSETEEESGKKKKKKKEKKKKEKKEKKSLFGRKGNAENIPEGDLGEKAGKGSGDSSEEEKKPGFIARLLSLLIETEEEDIGLPDRDLGSLEPSDENKNILEELEKEDKKKKKKKVKSKKEGGEGKEKKKKEKKPKKVKEKPAKEPDSEKDTKPGKRISKKGVLVIAALCLSLMAMIIVTCSMIPDFFEKREAREAFYESDYIKVYEMMYGKTLDESDEIIFHKAETILQLDRKLDSYQNYLGIGEEVRALDSLMSGVEKYPEILAKAEEYRVTQEVNAIYEMILGVLSDKYSISEEEARTIIAYSDVLYTKRLESLVNGTPFEEPSAAAETNEQPQAEQDILPEEQVIIEEDIPAEPEEVLPQEEEILQEGQPENIEPDGSLPQEGSSPEEQELPEEDVVPDVNVPVQEGSPSPGEDVSSWTGNSSFGSQGEQIQGIKQPIGVEIHGN